jgi:hypothetical protein
MRVLATEFATNEHKSAQQIRAFSRPTFSGTDGAARLWAALPLDEWRALAPALIS